MLHPAKTLAKVLLLILATSWAVEASPYDYEPRPLKECSPRDGWPNFYNKLERGTAVTIAYLGGSITEQRGWRVQTLEWFKHKYPRVQFNEVSAAIGGTGSNLGVFRLERDVLVHKPDLLLVEFAVNDAGFYPANIRKAMEGIVRKTRRQFPDCDIGFVYTLTARDKKAMDQGQMQRSASVMEQVAEHYGIPSIHFGEGAWELYKAGKLELVAKGNQAPIPSGESLNEQAFSATNVSGVMPFSRDGVHPYPNTGHVLYTQSFIRAADKIKAASSTTNVDKAGMPTPLVEDNWERAQMLTLSDNSAFKASGPHAQLSVDRDPLADKFSKRVPELWKFEPGSELSFQFKGTKIAIYDLKGPDCDAVEVELDGEKKIIERFDGHCSYHRLSILEAADNLEDRVHTITLRPLAGSVDKKAVLFDRNQKDFAEHPEKYAASNWYVGAILVVGSTN